MRKKLTVAAVARLRPDPKQRIEFGDALSPAILCIMPSGHKSWIQRFRRPNGKAAKLTLGPVALGRETTDQPVLGAPLTLGQARELANQVERQRKLGRDVIAEYASAKLRARTAVAENAANAFGTLVVEHFRDYRTRRWHSLPRRWRGDARLLGLRWPRDCDDPSKTDPEIIRGGLAQRWADKPISAIDGHDIHAVVDEARRLGIPGLEKHNPGTSENRGRKLHATLSTFFRWALQRRLVPANCCVGVWHPSAPPSRERCLSSAEIVAFWNATGVAGEPFTTALKMLLLSGQRLAEVSGMRWGELGADGLWTLPPERVKNHRQHDVPLPPIAQEMIAALPKFEGSELKFTANGATPINGWSRVKAKLDAAMGISGWRLHDLRRTTATGMAEIGIQPHIIEAVLNHVSGHKGGIAGVYNRAQYSEEKKVALARWAAHVLALVEGKPGKIVALRGPASS